VINFTAPAVILCVFLPWTSGDSHHSTIALKRWRAGQGCKGGSEHGQSRANSVQKLQNTTATPIDPVVITDMAALKTVVGPPWQCLESYNVENIYSVTDGGTHPMRRDCNVTRLD
jgi:hypothetical protein